MRFIICFFMLTLYSNIQASSSPYTHKKHQTVTALSDQERQQLLNGEGMGFALSAELNEYPGPKHVLELSDSLALTPSQLSQTQSLFFQMNQQAKALGAKLIRQEQELDALFKAGHITEQQIQRAVAKISTTRSELRALHLTAHLQQRDLLSLKQQTLYQQLRGYSQNNIHHEHSNNHRH